MSTIVAPTRGGQASYPNQDLAIRLAKERGAHLVFLYVSNVNFLDRMSVAFVEDLEEEMARTGEFILAMAEERAEQQGLASVESIVRTGNFADALKEVIAEREVDTVLIGSPKDDSGITDREYLEGLSEVLALEANVEVILADAGNIVNRREKGR